MIAFDLPNGDEVLGTVLEVGEAEAQVDFLSLQIDRAQNTLPLVGGERLGAARTGGVGHLRRMPRVNTLPWMILCAARPPMLR